MRGRRLWGVICKVAINHQVSCPEDYRRYVYNTWNDGWHMVTAQ